MTYKDLFLNTCLLAAVGASNFANAQKLPSAWTNYSIPSISEYYLSFGDTRVLKPNTTPYSINMSLNGDPRTRLGFAWFTNDVVAAEGGVVQIVAKANAQDADFLGAIEISSKEEKFGMNYMNTKNNAKVYDYMQYASSKYDGAAIANTRNYISHKALAENLSPDTQYSFRVGKPGAWSPIGSFRTAPNSNSFSFNYTTDTQANELSMFDISQQTITQAMQMFPNSLFTLNTGDFIETSSVSTTTSTTSEWEWERWFATMQPHWLRMPLVPVLGNHDMSVIDKNFSRHFNTDTSYNVENPNFTTRMDGTNYSFVYGNTLFMVLNYEEYSKQGYLDNLGKWIDTQVAKYPNVKWKVLASHRNVYTGAAHHDDSDQRTIRDGILPAIDRNKIDMYFQGHDHVYEVIGPVFDKKLVPNSVTDVKNTKGGTMENMTGKIGGTYNVFGGTLYMVNNSAGKKKYNPLTKAQMESYEAQTGVPNYWSLFTGRLGQTYEPTFSNVIITDESIKVTTYAVKDSGEAYLFDEIKIVKKQDGTLNVADAKAKKRETKLYPVPAKDILNIGTEDMQQAEIYDIEGKLILSTSKPIVDVSKLEKGIYVVRVIYKGGETTNHKVIIN